MANAKRVTRKTSSKIMRPPMTKKKLPELAVESAGKDLYLVYDGIRIAKRGERGTPEEETWIFGARIMTCLKVTAFLQL